MTTREPSCIRNHDVIRHKLRDEGLSPTACPDCGWLLKAAKDVEESAVARLRRLISIECTCRLIEKCRRCEAIDEED